MFLDIYASKRHNIKMWIDRNAEGIIFDFARQFPVVYISGARQVGKTSILAHLFPNFTYITLDDPFLAGEAINAPHDFIASLKLPVIIDEIQYAPELFRHIKIVVDQSKQKGQFFITGSQSFTLMQNLTESLAGRCGIVNLQPLSASEILKANKLSSIEDYISIGGFPELYVNDNINFLHWYPSYISTYLERDVRNIMQVGSLRDFNRFLRAVAIRTAQSLSYADLARDVGVSPNTIKAWLSVLLTSHIVYLLEPYYKNLGSRLVKSPKIYFLDTGLAAYLMGLYGWHDIVNSPMAGALWETYAFNQVYRSLMSYGIINPPLFYWRTKDNKEVDFVIEKGGRFIAFEAKLTGTPNSHITKGFNYLKNYYGEDSIIKSFVICKVAKDYFINNEIKAINGINIDF